MAIKSKFVCDSCEHEIAPLQGKIFQGNVYMCEEDTNARGGLIGNSFPTPAEDGTILAKDIKEFVLCDLCITKILKVRCDKAHSLFEEPL